MKLFRFSTLITHFIFCAKAFPFHVPVSLNERDQLDTKRSFRKAVPKLEFSSLVDLDYSENKLGPNPEETNPASRYLIEGDMVVSKIGLQGRTSLVKARSKWPDGIIPFEIDPTFSYKRRQDILDAMSHIQDNTCVHFVRKIDTSDSDFISFRPHKFLCASPVGRQGGEQFIEVANKCKFGTLVHEIVHALGFVHEQNRSDRNTYVDVFYDNIAPSKINNFNSYGPDYINDYDQLYDIVSIMHYGQYAFPRDPGRPTISIRDELVRLYQRKISHADTVPFDVYKRALNKRMGQREQLSDLDKVKINKRYCECDYDVNGGHGLCIPSKKK